MVLGGTTSLLRGRLSDYLPGISTDIQIVEHAINYKEHGIGCSNVWDAIISHDKLKKHDVLKEIHSVLDRKIRHQHPLEVHRDCVHWTRIRTVWSTW